MSHAPNCTCAECGIARSQVSVADQMEAAGKDLNAAVAAASSRSSMPPSFAADARRQLTLPQTDTVPTLTAIVMYIDGIPYAVEELGLQIANVTDAVPDDVAAAFAALWRLFALQQTSEAPRAPMDIARRLEHVEELVADSGGHAAELANTVAELGRRVEAMERELVGFGLLKPH